MHRLRIWLMLSLLGAGYTLSAQLPLARLSTVFPPGGKIGATVEVSITGLDLDDADRLYFSHSNITTTPKLNEATNQPETNKFIVTITSDVPPGIYDARVIGRFGVSNPRAFAVGDLPETTAPKTNRTVASAGEVALGTTVNGRADANAIDYFRFSAKQGQRVLIDCLTKAIDSRMDAALILSDANGKELARDRRGGLVDFTTPADGQYVLQVHDFLFRGGDEYFYRLTVSTSPYIDFIFPPSGIAGTKGKYVLYGRNLPGGTPTTEKTVDGKPVEKLEVEIDLPGEPAARQGLSTSSLIKPADSVLDGIEYRLKTPEGSSNPVLISFATAPVVTEQPPNDKPELAQRISLPCEYVGQFRMRGEPSWITFDAKKGDVYWVEVFSNRLGLPTGSFVLIQRVAKNDKGEEEVSDVQEIYNSEANIGGPEYNTTTRDPAARFEVKESGAYRLQVRDLFNRSPSSPRFVYRLSIRKETPDFRLVALAQAPPPANKDEKKATLWTAALRRGETLPIKVLVFRRDNFKGEIQLAVEGLPPEVSYAEAKIETGANSALLLVTATEAAADWVGPISIVGKAKVAESELVREARGGTVTWNVNDYAVEAVQSRMTRGFFLAVSGRETAPISIAPVENQTWETSVAGKLQIPLKVTRRGDFNGTVKVKASGLTALDSMKELDIAGKTNGATLELDLTQNKVPVGTHQFYLLAQTQGKYQRLKPEDAKAAEEAAKSAEEAVKQTKKDAEEFATAAKKSTEAFEVAAKEAEQAETLAKAAADKLTVAKTAAEKSSANEELLAARTAAEKEATETAAKSSAATEAKVAAKKTADEASAKAKVAEEKKTAAANRSKEAAEKTKLKDASVTAYSTPILLKITAAPITLSVETPASSLDQGAKIEIPVTINRLYGYNDSVELKLVFPKEIKGINAAKVTIAKDQSQGRLVIEAASDAPPGDHKLTLQAALKLNKQELKVDQLITLKVAAAK